MVTLEEWVKESFEQSLTQIFFVISPQLNKKVTILKCEIETSKGPIFCRTNFLKDDGNNNIWTTYKLKVDKNWLHIKTQGVERWDFLFFKNQLD